MTVRDSSYGRQRGHAEVYRGASTRSTSCPRSDWRSRRGLPLDASSVADIILKAAQTTIGDGKIWSCRSRRSSGSAPASAAPKLL